MDCWINPSVHIPSPHVFAMCSFGQRKSVKRPISPGVLLHGSMPLCPWCPFPGPHQVSGSGCCLRAMGQAGCELRWELCQCSHACLQCRLPGRCCSGVLCSPCSHVTLCHEMFSAIQPLLPAVVCVRCHAPGQRGGRRQRAQGISLVGLVSSSFLEAKPSRN